MSWIARCVQTTLLCLTIVVSDGANAEGSSGFRCGTRVISLSARTTEVRDKCGEPDTSDRRSEFREVARKRRVRGGGYAEEVEERVTVEVIIDEWTYDFGPTRFTRHLRFENGQLVDVSEGERGRKSK